MPMPHDDLPEIIQPVTTNPHLIRNFGIITRIGRGKSALTDRMLQLAGVVSIREIRAQYFGRMGIERERGVMIKSRAVRMPQGVDDVAYALNMIDMPGHVDLSYEVSRSLTAYEEVLLLVDASQGIEAQTLADLYLALENDLMIVPMLNKIDLSGAIPEKHVEKVAGLLGYEPTDCMMVSGKTEEDVAELLDRIVHEVPAPGDDLTTPTRAMIFDSVYNTYRGVVTYVRVVDRSLKARQEINMMSMGIAHELLELGVISPEPITTAGISAGEVDYLITGTKNVCQSRVGDTVTGTDRPAIESLRGYHDPMPMVYSELYPIEGTGFPVLRNTLDKLQPNDAPLTSEPETSTALGPGFRCDFLSLLHLEIIHERPEREFNLALVSTTPSVEYHAVRKDGTEVHVHNPSEFPDGKLQKVLEPMVMATILTPSDFVGPVMELCQDQRGAMKNMWYLSADRVELHYTLPLAEIVYDFFDQLKSRIREYASLDHHLDGEAEADLVRVDILLSGEQIDAFSTIMHHDAAYSYGTMMVQKLRKLIPRQQFEVPIQAAIGTRITTRESIRALRKDMLTKCYGDGITRKRKLLEKQGAGEKRMKAIGQVEVP